MIQQALQMDVGIFFRDVELRNIKREIDGAEPDVNGHVNREPCPFASEKTWQPRWVSHSNSPPETRDSDGEESFAG